MNGCVTLPPAAGRPYFHLVICGVTEYEFGWVFFDTTKEFLQTGDIKQHFPVGNAPFIVDKHDGRLYITGTAYPIDHSIAEYQRGNRRLA